MGNSASKKRKDWISTKQWSTDVDPVEHAQRNRSISPFRRAKSEKSELCDVPGKPGKPTVTLTNLQSDKPSGSCVTDSIYLDWRAPLNDGGRPIQGYSVEMYDLPTGNWITVTQTEGDYCRSMLDNILCGIMYRFRIRSLNEVGSSVPSVPSDAFVIDTPGVHIAPYFIICPPPEVSKFTHETVQFRAKALGTPTPNILWQKDHEPIFITQGIEIEEEPDGSLLTVHNLQLDDNGVIECIAVNHVGKAVATTNLHVISPPVFKTNNIPLHFSFRIDDLIRLKFPLEAHPEPSLTLYKDDMVQENVHCQALVRDSNAILKIDSAQERDTGSYRVDADNGFGVASLQFYMRVEVPPAPPSTPDILDVAPTGQLTLAWEAPECSTVDHYIVEYYRDQWKLWLRMKTCIDTITVISDLIPGSKYKFRVMAASTLGISEASPESEEIMIGKPDEDELFDLPRGRHKLKSTRKIPSFDRASLDRSIGSRTGLLPPGRRHTSLDREVYYDSNNIRRDVVTYKPPELDKIGSLANKYKLSNEELAKYRMSMSELCHKMKAVSNSSVNSRAGSRVSLDTATKPLQMEITNQARKSNSMGQLWSAPHIETSTVETLKLKATSSQFLAGKLKHLGVGADKPKRGELSNDINDCKKSLSDIRERIGSLQSLLKTSRTLTSSRPRLMADLPSFNIPNLDSKRLTAQFGENQMFTHRNDSYANAIDDPLVEACQETHFPYNPDFVSLGSLECDKFPQEVKQKHNSLFLTECDEEGSDVISQTVANFFSATIKPDSHRYNFIQDNSKGDNFTQDNSLRDNLTEDNSLRDNLTHLPPSLGLEEDGSDRPDTSQSGTLLDFSLSSGSDRTMLGSAGGYEEYIHDASESTATLLVERSLSSCSQGTLLADTVSIDSDSEELL